ncbi:MAG: hypothetical protein ACF8LL_14820, partial [Phycisphaerales bacterium]
MAADSSSEKRPIAIWRFVIPLVILLALTIVLNAAFSMHIANAITLASLVAGIAAVFTATRFAAPLLILSALTWSAHKSELSPITLINNRDQAVEYIFGRSLSEEERERVYSQADRTTRLSLRSDAEKLVLEELGLARTDPRPDGYEQRVETRYEQLRSALTEEEWERRVMRSARRAEQERKGGFFPLETGRESIELYMEYTLETIAIAIWGTLLAFVTALPVSL